MVTAFAPYKSIDLVIQALIDQESLCLLLETDRKEKN